MAKVKADNYPRTISQYVPLMEYASDVVGDAVIVSLGAPAALDADGIWDGVSATNSATSFTSADYKTTFDGSATSLTSTSGMIDAKYGRTLSCTGSAGSDHVCTISGRDYLGQLMKENITLSGTGVIAGVKAFKYVDRIDIATGAASDTVDVGWAEKLGLPYAATSMLSDYETQVIFMVSRTLKARHRRLVRECCPPLHSLTIFTRIIEPNEYIISINSSCSR